MSTTTILPWMASPPSLAVTAPLSSVRMALPPGVRRQAPPSGTPEHEYWLRAGAWVHNYPRDKGLLPWSWFGGLTFAREVSRDRAHASLRGWANELASEAAGHVLIAWGCEKQRRDVLHFQVLATFGHDATPLPCSVGRSAWNEGHSEIVPFQSDLGGAWYVVKALSFGLMWGCSRPPRCRRPGRRKGLCIYSALGFDFPDP